MWPLHLLPWAKILRKNGVALIIKKRVQNAILRWSLKNDRIISDCFWGQPFNNTVYTPTENAEEAEVVWFYEDLQDLLELTPKKDVLFIIRDWNTKMGSQDLPGVTIKFGLEVQNKAGKRLICQNNAFIIANTLFQQHKRWLYTWTSPDDQYGEQIDYIICSRRWTSSVQSAQTGPGADFGSDRQLLKKIQVKLKKIGKTTKPFKYDLNQLPYNYAVEVTNRFKELDLLECLKNYGHRFVTRYWKQSPRKRNARRKSCWVDCTNNQKVKGKGERQKYTPLNIEFQRTAKKDKKAFLSEL